MRRTLEQMPEDFVSSVEALGISLLEAFHSGDQVRRCLDQQMVMIMIAHQDISMDEPTGFLASFFQSVQEPFKILVVFEDMLPVVASRHDVVRSPGIFNAQWSRHRKRDCQHSGDL
jgi:hypothetical protein